MKADTTPHIYRLYDTLSMAEHADKHIFLRNKRQRIKDILTNSESGSRRVILPDVILDLVYSAGRVMGKTERGRSDITLVNESAVGLLSREYDIDRARGAALVSKLLCVERNSTLGVREDMRTADVFFVALVPQEQESLKPENLRVGWMQDSNGDLNTFKIIQNLNVDLLHCSPYEQANKLFTAYTLGVSEEADLVNDVETFLAVNT